MPDTRYVAPKQARQDTKKARTDPLLKHGEELAVDQFSAPPRPTNRGENSSGFQEIYVP